MPEQPRSPFLPADLLKQAMIREIDVSPDGGSVVYSRRVIEDNAYRTRLWRVGRDGGEPVQLTFADANDGAPSISPDGAMLAFVSDRSGSPRPWLLPLGGGEARQLAALDGASAVRWSPDGSRLVVTADSGVDRYAVGDPKDPIARRITEFDWRWDGVGILGQRASAWLVDPAGGEPVRLTDPDVDVRGADWLADGRVMVVANMEPQSHVVRSVEHADLWAIDPAAPDRAPERLTDLGGAVSAAVPGPGGAVAFIGTEEPGAPSWANRGLFVLEHGRVTRLAPDADLNVTNQSYGDLVDPASEIGLCWTGPRELAALVAVRGAALPYRFRLDDPAHAEPLASGELICSTLAHGGGLTVVVATDRGRAGEVCAVENGALRQLTAHGSAWLEPWRRDPERHAIPHPDGHEIDAWVVRARGVSGPAPTVLQIHGGPHASHGPTPWLEMLALADAGFTVIYTNPRGSTGYGQDFAREIHGSWGDTDAPDHLRVIDWAVEQGMTDPDRVASMGLSGGGYMTLWLLGHHPERFRAGIAENPVSDMVGMYGGSDLATYFDHRFVGAGRLPEDLEAFLRPSPFMALHRTTAPLLLLLSDEDLRCPPAQGELAFAILKSRGHAVEMVRYPGEPHYLAGIGRPDRRVDRIQRMLDWFGEHL